MQFGVVADNRKLSGQTHNSAQQNPPDRRRGVTHVSAPAPISRAASFESASSSLKKEPPPAPRAGSQHLRPQSARSRFPETETGE